MDDQTREQGKETLTAWLNDAYAMERVAEKNLERQLEDLAGVEASEYVGPLHTKLREALDTTRSHMRQVKGALERLEGGVSRIKSASALVGGMFGGRMATTGDDSIVKGVVGNYVSLHTQYGTYVAIAAAAEELDFDDIMNLAEQLSEEAREMAVWMEDFLPDLISWHLMSEGDRAGYWAAEEAYRERPDDIAEEEAERERARQEEAPARNERRE